MEAPLRIGLVLDDESMAAWGLSGAPAGLRVAYAGSLQGIEPLLRESPVDAIVVAAQSVAEIAALRRRWPSVRLVAATSSEDALPALEALDRGATGLVLLPTTWPVLTQAIATVVRGGLWIDAGPAEGVVHELGATLGLQVELQHGRALRARLKELMSGLTQVAAEKSVDAMLPAVVSLAKRLCHAQYAAMAVLDGEDRIAMFIPEGISDGQRRAIGRLPHGGGLLGEVIHTRRPLRVPSIQAHPSSGGFPPGHPPMTSFLGMPMLFQDEVVGHLYCTNHLDGEFTPDDEELLGLLARHAAVLIRTARLTEELEGAVLTEERQRISMDLHDGTLQALYALVLAMDTLLGGDTEAVDVRAVLGDFAERLTGIIQSVRSTVQNLRDNAPDLMVALEMMVAELSVGRTVRLQSTDAQYRRLEPADVDEVLGWAREAVSNALRHARAKHIDVTWGAAKDRYWLTVVDDGQGFDVGAARGEGHLGLSHLDRRAARLGGTVTLVSMPGAGTRVMLEAPWRTPAKVGEDAPKTPLPHPAT
jgi:signal transduction histidine kinase